MPSSNLLKSKIPMLRGGGGLVEFDAESKFAKIQNSHVEGGGGGGALWNLMLSPNLLKKKKKEKEKKFCEKMSKFSGKDVPGNGFRL